MSEPTGGDDQNTVRPVMRTSVKIPAGSGTAPSREVPSDEESGEAPSAPSGKANEETWAATASPAQEDPPSIPPQGSRVESSGGSAAPAQTQPSPPPRSTGAARRVRLSVSRVDPWSVMKLGFLLSVAAGIVMVVATVVAWQVLNAMGVFTDLESLVTDLDAMAQFGTVLEYLRMRNIMSLATIFAIINVALLTALSALGAFLYNIVAALVGGVHLTLTDD
ncbi:DUF3566 domain-containing protein [Serinibacter salmoneus]|uniref:Transmembrane protein DUF3566 n=1 Tax=Serinibacter salmoneus TaxID=556530 RepID=A0A2A9D3A7_9MICO|nr:DUF3566 domain-containing protein [Serinibacter salmoneus]PFG21143.1 transmembrane protein DUF3566 [Serinibacter salmoneus]